MKLRPAFTLVELIIAILLFSYMAASLSTVYSTANRHMFQNYRRNAVKSDVALAMRAIQNNLAAATRIDLPARNAQSNVLAFAVNVDQLTACYPVNPAVPASWHYFCLAADPLIPTSMNLYYHRANLPAGTPCGRANPSIWGVAYPVPACGQNLGGQTVTQLMRHVVAGGHVRVPPPANGMMFSRRTAEGADFTGAVRVTLRSYWTAADRGFATSQRDIDFVLDSVVNATIGN